MESQTPTLALDAAYIAELRRVAQAITNHAYAPYSRYHVGAALLLANGATVAGCNVENASYRLTCCAEQSAVVRAVAEHGPGMRIVAVAVANADATLACQPCGACRQMLAEFANGDCRIFYPGEGGKPGECTLADLLPSSFSAASMGQSQS